MQTKKGVTLAELMIAISIFAIFVVTFSMGNVSTANIRDTMRSEIVEFLGYYSAARTAAMTNEVVEKTEAGGTKSLVFSVPFGVHLENTGKAVDGKKNHLVLFADINSNGKYDPDNGNGIWEDGEDTVLQEKNFFQTKKMQEVNVKPFINGLSLPAIFPSSPTDNITAFSVTFASPGGEARIEDDNSLTSSYQDFEMFFNLGDCNEGNYTSSDILCEKMTFNTIQRFFDRVQLFP